MIKISITKVSKESYTETQNFVVKETATDKIETTEGYGNTQVKKPVMDREYQVQEITKSREVTTTLLGQELDDEQFNLKRVIAAINDLAGDGDQ